MNRPNQPIDDAVKNTLQQHEFDFDASAWEAMDKKLNDGQEERRGINGPGLFALFIGLALLGFFAWSNFASPAFESEAPQMAKQHTASSTEDKSSASIESAPPSTEGARAENAGPSPLLPPATVTESFSPTHNTESSTEGAGTTVPPSAKGQVAKGNSNLTPLHQSADSNTQKQRSPSTSTTPLSPSSNASSSTTSSQVQPLKTGKNNMDTTLFPEAGSGVTAQKNKATQKGTADSLEKVFTNKNSIITPTPNSEDTRSRTNEVALLSTLPTRTVETTAAPIQVKKAFSNLKEISIRKPFRWYLGAELGALFPSSINGQTPINDYVRVSRLARENKRLHWEAKAGIHLRKNTALELGLSYSSVSYLFEYTYPTDPTIDYNTASESVEQKVHQIKIPLRWQIKMGEDIRLGFGAGLSIRSLDQSFSSEHVPTAEGEELYRNAEDIYQPVLGFWESSLGYDRGQWTLDLRFQRFFTPLFKTFDYQGQSFTGNAVERSFSLAFGHRFQKFQDPIKAVKSTINQTKIAPFNPRFNWGVGVATGHDDHRASEPFSYINFELNEVITPLKLGVWGYQDIFPEVRVQGEVWAQKYKLSYTLDDGGGVAGGELDTNFVAHQINISRLEIPLTVHYILTNKIRISAGLGWEFNFTKPAEETFYSQFRGYDTFIQNLPTYYNKSNFTYDLGVGYDWAQFSFDIRYRAPLKATDQLFNKVVQFSQKEQIEVSLKYAFRRR